jgi:hypothetical protein
MVRQAASQVNRTDRSINQSMLRRMTGFRGPAAANIDYCLGVPWGCLGVATGLIGSLAQDREMARGVEAVYE